MTIGQVLLKYVPLSLLAAIVHVRVIEHVPPSFLVAIVQGIMFSSDTRVRTNGTRTCEFSCGNRIRNNGPRAC